MNSVAETLGPEAVNQIRFQARMEWARRCAAEKDILGWGKALFPAKFSLPFCQELHGYFVTIRHRTFTNTEAPRGRSKTTIKCFLIPLFQAMEEPNTYRHYLNVQATEDKALEVNRSIKKELENNQALIRLYGDQMGERWTDGQFVLKNGVAFTGVGAGQSIRGINYRNARPDYLIVDDLYDNEDINNPESTLKKNAWFWGDLYPARAQSGNTCVHVQGTAINNEDLLEELKKKPGVESATFQVVKDWDKKIVLWPEQKSWDEVMAEKAITPSTIWYREYQNERRDDATSIVKPSWIKEYDPAQVTFNLQFQIAQVLIGCDPSIGEKVENDFTGVALVLEARHSDGRGSVFYVENVWNEHLSLHQRVALLQRIADSRPTQYPVTRAFIEGIAGFKDFVAEVKHKTNLPVREIDRVKDKITNLENKSHYFENGKVFINKDIAPELKDMLIYQITTNHPRHDDMRDAVLLCLDDRTLNDSWI